MQMRHRDSNQPRLNASTNCPQTAVAGSILLEPLWSRPDQDFIFVSAANATKGMKGSLNPWGSGLQGTALSSSTDFANSENNKVKSSSIQTVDTAYGKLRNVLEVSSIVFGMEVGLDEGSELHPNEFVLKLRNADEKLQEHRRRTYESKVNEIMAESSECKINESSY